MNRSSFSPVRNLRSHRYGCKRNGAKQYYSAILIHTRTPLLQPPVRSLWAIRAIWLTVVAAIGCQRELEFRHTNLVIFLWSDSTYTLVPLKTINAFPWRYTLYFGDSAGRVQCFQLTEHCRRSITYDGWGGWTIMGYWCVFISHNSFQHHQKNKHHSIRIWLILFQWFVWHFTLFLAIKFGWRVAPVWKEQFEVVPELSFICEITRDYFNDSRLQRFSSLWL